MPLCALGAISTSSRIGTYRKTESIESYLRIWGSFDPIESSLIQSYLSIWGRYDPIETGPSEPKKRGVI